MSSCLLTARAVCASLGALALLAAVPALAGVLHSPQGYAVTVPAGWVAQHRTVSYPDGGHTDVMFAHPARSLALFRVEVDPQGQATMRDAEEQQAAFVQGQGAAYHVVLQRLRTLAGSPASETAAAGPFEGRPVLIDMIYTIHAGRVYTVTLLTPLKATKSDLATLSHMLGSLRFTPPAAS